MQSHSIYLAALAFALAGCDPGETPTDPSAGGATDTLPMTDGGTSDDGGDDGDDGPEDTDPDDGADDGGGDGADGAGETGAVSEACANLVGEGFAEGQIAENWTLMDGAGNPVNLHDYCGKVIFLEIGSEW